MADTNPTSPSSVFGDTKIITTPRRQLSYVEHTPKNEDKGYSSMSSTSSCSTYRVPLEEIRPNGGCVMRKTLQAKRSFGKPYNEKMVPHRPSSLPTLSPSLSSPMGRMSLMSPTAYLGSLGSQQSSRPPSTTSSDGYMSEVFIDLEESEKPTLSSELSSLINASVGPTPMTCQISHKNEVVRPTPLHRSGSCQADFKSTNVTSDQRRGSLKRSSPMSDLNGLHCGKRRPLPFSTSQDPPSSTKPEQEVLFKRSQSCSMASSSTPFSPIGDNSKPYALPLVDKHSDLKYISPDTLCDLLKGEFSNPINRYTIVDCRYSYEYEGGHVQGAINISTEEDLLDKFFPKGLQYPQVCEVVVLYCEFSSKRGPKMSRFLRGTDRKVNGELFPKLFYPEVYLLHCGYSTFFAKYPEMCDPRGYVPMVAEDNLARAKNKVRRARQHHH